MTGFTKQKFLSLGIPQQHKKCCDTLRTAYEDSGNIGHYIDFMEWMALPPLPANDHKTLADRFHWHLQQTGRGLKEHRLLPSVTRGDREEGAEYLPIAIYLDHIRSAHNIGSIIRTTEALRLGTLYAEDTAFINRKQVCDAAMGTQEWVKSCCIQSLEVLPRPVICLETSADAIAIHDFIFPESFTLVVGNEEYGCSDRSLAIADHLVTIPMHGRKNSLNVANAFAITAAEIRRQHYLTSMRKDSW